MTQPYINYVATICFTASSRSITGAENIGVEYMPTSPFPHGLKINRFRSYFWQILQMADFEWFSKTKNKMAKGTAYFSNNRNCCYGFV